MAATQESTSPCEAALSALNDAANAHHAIKATAEALSGAVYARGDTTIVGMYEALCLGIAALDRSLGRATEQLEALRPGFVA